MNLRLVLGMLAVGGLLDSQTGPAPGGTVEHVKVHGKSLEGNLEGDSPDRDVFIYLPASYAANPNRRYPVVYLLHGYGLTAERWMSFVNLPVTADKARAREMILVSPDAFTLYSGSMYSSSATIGDWETFIARDLVAYIDSHYRTIADRGSRGIAGHSMGGYGTMRIAMKRPDVFSSMYPMSACCLSAQLAPRAETVAQAEALKSPADAKDARNLRTTLAFAASWSPNPKSPPFFFDLPYKNGQLQPAIVAKWAANAPLAMVSQYVPSLKMYKAIALEVGLEDNLASDNQALSQLLNQLGLPHTFETYEGNHTNRVVERFETRVLPFFSSHLTFDRAAK